MEAVWKIEHLKANKHDLRVENDFYREGVNFFRKYKSLKKKNFIFYSPNVHLISKNIKT